VVANSWGVTAHSKSMEATYWSSECKRGNDPDSRTAIALARLIPRGYCSFALQDTDADAARFRALAAYKISSSSGKMAMPTFE
jgi:hypothetical protein